MIGLYLILAVLIISGSWFLQSAVKVRDYLLAIAGVAMVGMGVWMFFAATGVGA